MSTYIFSLFFNFLNILNTVIHTILLSLSTNSSISVISESVRIDRFFSSLWIILFCFFAYLVMLFFIFILHARYWVLGLFQFLSIFLSFVHWLSYFEIIWSFQVLLFSFDRWDQILLSNSIWVTEFSTLMTRNRNCLSLGIVPFKPFGWFIP